MFDDVRGNGGDGGEDEFFSFGGRPMHYILDGQKVVPVSLMVWARWFENFDNRRVKCHRFRGLMLSTVFIGLDASIDGPPSLFETGLFVGNGKTSRMVDSWRASTWDEATTRHRETLYLMRSLRSGRRLALIDSESRAFFLERLRYQPGE